MEDSSTLRMEDLEDLPHFIRKIAVEDSSTLSMEDLEDSSTLCMEDSSIFRMEGCLMYTCINFDLIFNRYIYIIHG